MRLWYKAFIGKAILFRTVQAIVKARKFPAYQANITTYTVACVSWKSGGNIDFDRIWSHQALSPQMQAMIDDWVAKINQENSAAPPVPGCQANGQRRCNAGKQCAMLRSTCQNLVRLRCMQRLPRVSRLRESAMRHEADLCERRARCRRMTQSCWLAPPAMLL